MTFGLVSLTKSNGTLEKYSKRKINECSNIEAIIIGTVETSKLTKLNEFRRKYMAHGRTRREVARLEAVVDAEDAEK